MSWAYRWQVPLTGKLALIDGVVAVVLLLSVARQQRNKAAVLAVASVLLGISGWLAVLAMSHDEPSRPVPTSNGQTA